MADEDNGAQGWRRRAPIIGGVLLIALIVAGVWWWRSRGRESTDDAQIDGHITPVSARVGGHVKAVHVRDNQRVDAGTVLVELDPADFALAVERAKAELADTEANAAGAHAGVPITTTTTASGVSTAQAALQEAQGGVAAAEHEITAARARLNATKARLREKQAEAVRTSRDVERLQPLSAKDEIPKQQFDAIVAAADAARAASEAAAADVTAAEAAVTVAQNRLVQARSAADQAAAAVAAARTAPEQVTATRAKASSADARVQQARAALAQAELNLQYTTIKAMAPGVISKKTVEIGQVIQPGQPLMALISLDDVWVTANFKETQLESMRPGQPAEISVDAYGGRDYRGHVESIAPATGARFSLLPPENATGNYVKVVQRVPVKIVFEPGQDPDHLLRPGMSVEPTVFVR
jgi:membrane fusion protein, multidrug efflux system